MPLPDLLIEQFTPTRLAWRISGRNTLARLFCADWKWILPTVSRYERFFITLQSEKLHTHHVIPLTVATADLLYVEANSGEMVMKPVAVALSSSPYLAVGAGAVGMHAFGAQAPWSELANTYADPRFWVTFLVIAACGALGGVVYELVRWRGMIELPHRVGSAETNESNPDAPAYAMIDLGVVGRAVSGAAAAVAVQWLVPSGSAEATLALAVTAGLTASPIIRTLRRQIVALANRQNKTQQPTHRTHKPAADAADASKTNVRDFQRSA